MENADKQIAWFPASYLEDIDVHKDIQNALSSKEEGKSASGSQGHHVPPAENEFCKNPTTSISAWSPCLGLWSSDSSNQLCHRLWVSEQISHLQGHLSCKLSLAPWGC